MNDEMPWSFESISDAYREPLEQAMVEALSGLGVLEEMGVYHLASGGKRLRGLIPLWIMGNCGEDPAQAMELGACLELMHNATLVHDDVQDGDALRRGQPTVWKKWGVPQAINLGDALFFRAFKVINRYAETSPYLSELVNDALVHVIAGQAMEFQLVGPEASLAPTLENWRAMAAGKTGALFGACLESVFHLRKADSQTTQSYREFGSLAGVFFQAQDDFLDLIGTKGRDFKGTDLAEGKISFPVAWACENAPRSEADRLLAIVRTPRSDTTRAMVEEGLQLLETTGALSATADWLRTTSQSLLEAPEGRIVPGLIAKFLEPVAHALSPS